MPEVAVRQIVDRPATTKTVTAVYNDNAEPHERAPWSEESNSASSQWWTLRPLREDRPSNAGKTDSKISSCFRTCKVPRTIAPSAPTSRPPSNTVSNDSTFSSPSSRANPGCPPPQHPERATRAVTACRP